MRQCGRHDLMPVPRSKTRWPRWLRPKPRRRRPNLARDAFTQAFRHAATEQTPFPLEALHTQCQDWVRAEPDADARALRMALLLAGLDQWGLAFSQAFGIQAIPPLTALIGALRTGLDPEDEARFQQQFETHSTPPRPPPSISRSPCAARSTWPCGTP